MCVHPPHQRILRSSFQIHFQGTGVIASPTPKRLRCLLEKAPMNEKLKYCFVSLCFLETGIFHNRFLLASFLTLKHDWSKSMKTVASCIQFIECYWWWADKRYFKLSVILFPLPIPNSLSPDTWQVSRPQIISYQSKKNAVVKRLKNKMHLKVKYSDLGWD